MKSLILISMLVSASAFADTGLDAKCLATIQKTAEAASGQTTEDYGGVEFVQPQSRGISKVSYVVTETYSAEMDVLKNQNGCIVVRFEAGIR